MKIDHLAPFLERRHFALLASLQNFLPRLEPLDRIADDAATSDQYMRAWARTQEEMYSGGKMPDELGTYLRKIHERGFTGEGILGAVAVEVTGLLAREGLLQHLIPASYGGAAKQIDPVALCLIRRALAGESCLADVMFAMQGLGSCAVVERGSESLRKRILPQVAEGRLVASIALTEPGAGSDLLSIETVAKKQGHSYRIHGLKSLISNAGVADIYTVFARTGRGRRRDALTAFLVEKTMPGLKLSRRLDPMSPHPLGDLAFEGVEVPETNRIGLEGEGLQIAMNVLRLFRPSVGAAAAGMADRALREAVGHVRRRRQFDQPLSEFQGVRFHLADMATELRAIDLVVFHAAWTIARGDGPLESSMAKLYATETAQRIIDRAVQLHGGRGVIRGSRVEQLYRAIRALRIYEGASDIQRSIIAKQILKGSDRSAQD